MPPDSPPPVIECNSLTKVFQDFWGRGRVLAVDQLELAIYPGEVFGLLGPNGSGKTTTIKMLLGLLYPTRGRARVFGRLPTDTVVKSRIGFMPEESYMYRFLNAVETLDYYGRLFKLDRTERRRRIGQLIEMVGLKAAAHRPVGEYSKGMARRIGLAQALINDPDLLILDEPTTGLDPIGSRQIKDVILELAKRGKTVLLCSHLLADVEDICDRIAIMYGGRCRTIGRVGDLLSRKDVTQITATRLDDATVSAVRAMIERDRGQRILSVDHPTDRLEELFLRVVERAERDKLATSGAEATRGVSEFLAAAPGAPDRRAQTRELLAQLVQPAAAVESESIGAEAAPAEPARPVPKFEKLEELVQPPATEPEAEPSEPREVRLEPTRPAARRDILEKLASKDAEDSPPNASPS
ncbi:MAG: ABC transporter ATP-binding protein [Phycisphaerae bacterium]|nr:ABC transporter ATP-binding protein [Phycisphaerae bacterium]